VKLGNRCVFKTKKQCLCCPRNGKWVWLFIRFCNMPLDN